MKPAGKGKGRDERLLKVSGSDQLPVVSVRPRIGTQHWQDLPVRFLEAPDRPTSIDLSHRLRIGVTFKWRTSEE